VDNSLATAFLSSGRFKTAEDWADRKLLEDEAYPEKLIDLDRLFNDSGDISPSARNLRRKVDKFAKSGERLVDIPIDEGDENTDWGQVDELSPDDTDSEKDKAFCRASVFFLYVSKYTWSSGRHVYRAGVKQRDGRLVL
jgi:hypothetical protein